MEDQNSDAGIRVMLARDVIAQLDSGKIFSSTGSFVELDHMSSYAWREDTSGVDLKNLVEEAKACWVCAKGALFIARVCRFNDVSSNDVNGPGNWPAMRKYLKEFTDTQLEIIEIAYEGYSSDIDQSPAMRDQHCKFIDSKLTLKLATAWHLQRKMSSPINRMKEVMQNIIDNKGEFIP